MSIVKANVPQFYQRTDQGIKAIVFQADGNGFFGKMVAGMRNLYGMLAGCLINGHQL